HTSGLDDWYLDNVSINQCRDTDGDGIPDFLDLDSDNDGCPDAIEGGASIIDSQLQNSTMAGGNTGTTSGTYNLPVIRNIPSPVGNTTTTLGVPTIAGTGQSIGSSINASVVACCDAAASGYLDSDGDNITNICDLDDDNDGILDTLECNLFAATNAGFETPNITLAPYNSTTFALVNETATAGWKTTATDHVIEIWRSGFGGVPSAEGDQFAELNANQVSTLYQNFTLNGNAGTISWSVKHRGRSGVDVARVRMGTTLAAVADVATMTDGNTAWGTYTGTYTVPAGQTNLTIAFESVSSVGGATFGNFLDEIRFTFLEDCDIDGDGIPNNLDLDSDNDGCPDAVEGGGTIVDSQLQNSTMAGGNTGATSGTYNLPVIRNIPGPVNTTSGAANYGVPTLAGTGQSVGSSQNPAINSCVCYNDPATGTGVDTKHGITLLQRAGVDNGNWPMIRQSAHTVLESNTKGLVITRMTTSQVTAIASPQDGMMVYDTDLKCLKLYDGTAWSCFSTPTCP
ncbi:thrombospondin type 3 repeat-containing protein, partial [Frigoriflavimonas asaccharolytica]